MDQTQRSFPAVTQRALPYPDPSLGILDLPDTVVLKIFANFAHPELCRIALVCKHWLWIVNDSELWKYVDLQKFQNVNEDSMVQLIRSRLSPLLRTLNLGNASITPVIFNELADNCKQLSTLSLKDCIWDLSEENEQMQLALPTNLTRLDIRNFGQRGSFLHLVMSAPDMSKLECFGFGNENSLSSCPTFIDFRNLFSKMSNLQILDCCDSEIVTDKMIADIAEDLPLLKSLSVKKCSRITGSSLHVLLSKATQLTSLILASTNVTDASLSNAIWENSKIEEFDLSLCDKITSVGLLAVLPYLPHLQYLCLNNCGRGKAVTDDVMLAIRNKILWPCLETLSLQFCCRLTSVGLTSLNKCSKIKILSLRSCPRFGFFEICEILPHFRELKVLEAGSIFAPPEKSVSWQHLLTPIPDHCQMLETLVLLKCSGLTLGNAAHFRPRIFEFLDRSKNLSVICLPQCDARIVNLFIAAACKLSETGRSITVLPSNLDHPVIPHHRHSIDTYMKGNNFM